MIYSLWCVEWHRNERKYIDRTEIFEDLFSVGGIPETMRDQGCILGFKFEHLVAGYAFD